MASRPSLTARAAACALLALSFVAGCGSSAQPAKAPQVAAIDGPVTPLDVKDQDFAPQLHRLLKDGSYSRDRLALLLGVVKRQLAHAEKRFALGQEERGTDSVMGAFYLLRAGEVRDSMIDEAGAKALGGAIGFLSLRGDEGRVHTLMRMREAALPKGSPERVELSEHLANLERWMTDTRGRSKGAQLGADERIAVARALVKPSQESLGAATKAVEAWIDHAIEINRAFHEGQVRPTRDEALEAARALSSGAATLAGIYIRQGNAKGALERLEGSTARLIATPQFRARLHDAATGEDPRAWEGLAAAFAHHDSSEDDPEVKLDPLVVEASIWGASLEAYRRDPKNLDAAGLLAEQLAAFGLSEGVPLVLADAIGTQPSPQTVAASLRLVFSVMAADAGIDDLDTARRTFRAAEPLVAAADRMAGALGHAQPSVARLRQLAASVELRAGDMAAARALYEAAAKAEPSVNAWMQLSRIDRQAGDAKRALADVALALSAPDARQDLLGVVEANLLAFALHRDLGEADQARASLADALAAALAARQQRVDTPSRAQAELSLGRVLDAYGEQKAASRALQRALTLASTERPLLGVTMLQAVGRALVHKDLAAARAALKQGLDADVDQEDRVYGGLWVMLLEREMGSTPDGTAERALSTGADRSSWTAKLSAWATGKLSDADLGGAAQNASQRVEADFYTAMARKVAGDPAALERLRGVARAPMVDLLEIQIAQELVAPPLEVKLPPNTVLP
jgi:tetratricopeptide (TPR) repeat protein